MFWEHLMARAQYAWAYLKNGLFPNSQQTQRDFSQILLRELGQDSEVNLTKVWMALIPGTSLTGFSPAFCTVSLQQLSIIIRLQHWSNVGFWSRVSSPTAKRLPVFTCFSSLGGRIACIPVSSQNLQPVMLTSTLFHFFLVIWQQPSSSFWYVKLKPEVGFFTSTTAQVLHMSPTLCSFCYFHIHLPYDANASQENLKPLSPSLCLVPCHSPPLCLFLYSVCCFIICWFYFPPF